MDPQGKKSSKRTVHNGSKRKSELSASTKYKRRKVNDWNLSDQYVRPLEHGWKREVVVRCSVKGSKSGRYADIYYHTPTGKKLRSMPEVVSFLQTDATQGHLNMENFTFHNGSIFHHKNEWVRNARDRKLSSTMEKVKPRFDQDYSVPRLRGKVGRISKIGNAKKSVSRVHNADELSKIMAPRIGDKVERGSCLKEHLMTLGKFDISSEPPVLSPISDLTMLSPPYDQPPILTVMATSTSPQQMCNLSCPNQKGVCPTLECQQCMSLFHPGCLGAEGNQELINFICQACKVMFNDNKCSRRKSEFSLDKNKIKKFAKLLNFLKYKQLASDVSDAGPQLITSASSSQSTQVSSQNHHHQLQSNSICNLSTFTMPVCGQGANPVTTDRTNFVIPSSQCIYPQNSNFEAQSNLNILPVPVTGQGRANYADIQVTARASKFNISAQNLVTDRISTDRTYPNASRKSCYGWLLNNDNIARIISNDNCLRILQGIKRTACQKIGMKVLNRGQLTCNSGNLNPKSSFVSCNEFRITDKFMPENIPHPLFVHNGSFEKLESTVSFNGVISKIFLPNCGSCRNSGSLETVSSSDQCQSQPSFMCEHEGVPSWAVPSARFHALDCGKAFTTSLISTMEASSQVSHFIGDRHLKSVNIINNHIISINKFNSIPGPAVVSNPDEVLTQSKPRDGMSGKSDETKNDEISLISDSIHGEVCNGSTIYEKNYGSYSVFQIDQFSISESTNGVLEENYPADTKITPEHTFTRCIPHSIEKDQPICNECNAVVSSSSFDNLSSSSSCLNDQLWEKIFKFLSTYEVLAVSKVCARWRRISRSDVLWESVKVTSELLKIMNSRVDEELTFLGALEEKQPQLMDLRALNLNDENVANQFSEILLSSFSKLSRIKSMLISFCPLSLLDKIRSCFPHVRCLSIERQNDHLDSFIRIMVGFRDLKRLEIRSQRDENVSDVNGTSVPKVVLSKNEAAFHALKRDQAIKENDLYCFSKLEELKLFGSPHAASMDFTKLFLSSSFDKLHSLTVSCCQHWDEKMYALLGNLVNLTALDLRHGGGIPDPGLSLTLSKMKGLLELKLSNYVVDWSVSLAIQKLQHLKKFHIHPMTNLGHVDKTPYVNLCCMSAVWNHKNLQELTWVASPMHTMGKLAFQMYDTTKLKCDGNPDPMAGDEARSDDKLLLLSIVDLQSKLQIVLPNTKVKILVR